MNRLMEFNIQLFAHKKGQSSTSNGRDSAGRRLGATDDTLFVKISGYVKYSPLGKDRKQVSVYETK